jgi:hypothetical protein
MKPVPEWLKDCAQFSSLVLLAIMARLSFSVRRRIGRVEWIVRLNNGSTVVEDEKAEKSNPNTEN